MAIALLAANLVVGVPNASRSAVSHWSAHEAVVQGPLPRNSTIHVPIGSDLADLVLDPIRPLAYVADRTKNRVLVVGLDNGTILRTLPTQTWPFALAIDPSARTLYVGHAANRTIEAIDLATYTVVRSIPTEFLTAQLVAPRDDALIATDHDPDWSYPYVINSTDGTVLQRLGLSSTQNFPTYQDSLAALSGDRTHLFLADTQVYPTTMKAFVWDSASSSWILTAVSPGGGHLGDIGRDLAVSPDNRYVYLATLSNSVLRVDASNLAYAGTIGPYTVSTAVVVSATGARIGVSAYDSAAHVFDASGLGLGNLSFSDRVERMRVTADGTRLVATVGAVAQDLEIVLATTAAPVRPVGLTSEVPDVQARIVTFEDHRDFSATMDVDGSAVAASYDVSSGIVHWLPPRRMSEQDHAVVAHIWRAGIEVARANWTFTFDGTAPALAVIPIPSRTAAAAVDVTGTVTDVHFASLTVAGVPITPDPQGAFRLRVPLQPGQNRIFVVASDAAGLTTIRELDIFFDLPRDPYLDTAAHFGIRVPQGWRLQPGAPSGYATNLHWASDDGLADIRIIGDVRALSGTSEEAQAILKEKLDAIAVAPGYVVLEPVHAATVDRHAAATAFVEFDSNQGRIRQTVTVVLAPEWRTAFVLSGAVVGQASDAESPYINETLATFDVLTAAPSGFFDNLASAGPTILVIVGAGVAAEGAILLALRARKRRGRSSE
ncbi:MAG TPA: hypothetical protein VJP06_05350 [Thermoplasmata archaeon]|nr:hypothetical protein [Thermoplasmata archaeon]